VRDTPVVSDHHHIEDDQFQAPLQYRVVWGEWLVWARALESICCREINLEQNACTVHFGCCAVSEMCWRRLCYL